MTITLTSTDATDVTLPVTGFNGTQSVTNSTSLTDATGLGFTIEASEKWIATFELDAGAALSTTGIKLAVNAPTGAAVTAIAVVNPDVITTGKTYAMRSVAIDGTLDFTAADLASVGFALIQVKYYVGNGTTAGTIQLQFAQSTSSATAVSLRTGSSFVAFRVG